MPRLRMTKLSSPLLHPKWAHAPVGHMPMAPPLGRSPIKRAACLPRELAAWVDPGLGPAPVTLPAADQETRTVPAAAVVVAALVPALVTLQALVPAVAAEAGPVEVTNPALDLVTLTALVLVTSLAAVEDTKCQFDDE